MNREEGINRVCSDIFWRDFARPESERIPLTRESGNALFISCLVNRHIGWQRAMNLVPEMQKRSGYTDTIRMFSEQSTEMIEWDMFSAPALHRFHYFADMTHCAACGIRDEYDSDVRNMWSDEPTASQLYERLCDFRGYGNKTASLFIRVACLVHNVRLFDSFQGIMPADDRHVRRVGARLGLFAEDAPVKVINEVAIRLNVVCPATLDTLFEIGTDWCKAGSTMCRNNDEGEPCPLRRFCVGALIHG
jgi:hypothetical protein